MNVRSTSTDSNEPVRRGVVGLGFVGRTHATNAESFGHEVVAGADIVPDTREEFGRTDDAATYEEFVVRGTEAGARLECGGEELTMYQDGTQGTDHLLNATVTEGAIDHTGWAGSDKLFLDAATAGTAPELNTVEQALAVQRVIDAIYRSAETGGSVSVES